MLRALIRRRTDGDTEAGAALVVVIALTAVMLVALSVGLTGVTSSIAQSNSTQSSTRALDAAYAGVQDYIAKLNTDSTYPQYGNPTAPFSSASTRTVKLPTTANPAFGVGTTGTWAAMPGSTTGATFRYEVDNSLYGSSGLLRLRSTGRYGSATRTIVASIQQQGFINYLYFTNYEIQDPQITGTTANCDRYLWATPTRSTTSCPTIQFGPNDVLDGPVRSNDTFTICGSTFNGSVTTSNSGTPLVATPSSCSSTARYNGSRPQSAPVLAMPDTNTSMKAQTYTDVATTTTPGCLYTGPTQITLKSNGTMTVVSPWTQYTNTTADGTSGTNPDVCGSISDLHSTRGATIPVPASNLVYVQSVPTTPSDVNSTPSTATTTSTQSCSSSAYYNGQCATSSGASCGYLSYLAGRCMVTVVNGVTGGAVPSSVTQTSWNSNTTYTCTGADGSAMATTGSSGSAGWIFRDGNGTIRFPLASEDPASNWSNGSAWDTTTPAYGCRNGDAFVSGTLSGKLTIASDNYVYATGDVLYDDPTSDVLGLVGNNGVLVWNPMNGSTPLLTAKNREIDAAVLSPAHTFQVQNYDVGPYRGVLTINGSIAQKYRGPVAQTSGSTTTSGYAKSYGYDSRFITVTPPYYLKPTSASFRVSSYASTTAAFAPSGASQ